MVKVDSPYYRIEYIPNGMEALRLIEACGRTSYKSDSKLINEYDKVKDSIPDLKLFLDKVRNIVESLYNKNGRDYYYDIYNKYPKTINRDLELTKDASALQFVKMIIENGHLSVLEFSFLVVRFYVNIGFTREENRHRLTSIIERSTRYCNFSEDRFDNSVHFIDPIWFDTRLSKYKDIIEGELVVWNNTMQFAEDKYLSCVKRLTDKANKYIEDPKERADFVKQIPQMARGVLPLDTVSEECVGANFREWSDVILFERASSKAHPSMQQIMYELRKDLQKRIPVVFDYTKRVTRTFE